MSNPTRTEEDITRGLMALVAFRGNAKAASESLAKEGLLNIKPSTLAGWSHRYMGRYEELRERHRDQIEKQIVGDSYELVSLAQELERKALSRAIDRVESGQDNDPSRTAANAATVADKTTRDMLTLQSRPTSIREDRGVEDLLRSLTQMGVVRIAGMDVPQIEETGDGQ